MAGSPIVLPSVVVTPYDANGNWAGYGMGVSVPVTMTDAEYAAWLPPAVAGVYAMPQGADRIGAAGTLAAQGYAVDFEIVALGYQTPTLTQVLRVQDGYTWVNPMLGAPILLPPGDTFPGLPTYDPQNPPPGALVVSVSSTAYPPLAAPNTNAPAPGVSVIGPNLGLTSDELNPPVAPTVGVWSSLASSHYAEGYAITATPPVEGAAAGTFVYHLLGSELMSPSQRIGVWLGPQPAAANQD